MSGQPAGAGHTCKGQIRAKGARGAEETRTRFINMLPAFGAQEDGHLDAFDFRGAFIGIAVHDIPRFECCMPLSSALVSL